MRLSNHRVHCNMTQFSGAKFSDWSVRTCACWTSDLHLLKTSLPSPEGGFATVQYCIRGNAFCLQLWSLDSIYREMGRTLNVNNVPKTRDFSDPLYLLIRSWKNVQKLEQILVCNPIALKELGLKTTTLATKPSLASNYFIL